MAAFILATGMQPSEYRQLTLTEYKAIIKRLEDGEK